MVEVEGWADETKAMNPLSVTVSAANVVLFTRLKIVSGGCNRKLFETTSQLRRPGGLAERGPPGAKFSYGNWSK